MTTYLLLNVVFIGAVILVMRLLRIPFAKKWHLALIPLLILTAIFDPLIIHFDIVGYEASRILGIRLFGAPIEDFMYSMLAAVMVPSLWNHLHQKHQKRAAQ